MDVLIEENTLQTELLWEVISLHALCGRGVENKGERTRKNFDIHDLLPGN